MNTPIKRIPNTIQGGKKIPEREHLMDFYNFKGSWLGTVISVHKLLKALVKSDATKDEVEKWKREGYKVKDKEKKCGPDNWKNLMTIVCATHKIDPEEKKKK